MIFPELTAYLDWPLLLLRIVVGIVFFSSGWSHMTKPEERSESIGMSKLFTLLLGIGEVAGSIGVALGIYIQVAAIILSLAMLGAIQKKIFVWKTGFYGDDSMGWHYDLIFLAANLLFLFSGGGHFVLI